MKVNCKILDLALMAMVAGSLGALAGHNFGAKDGRASVNTHWQYASAVAVRKHNRKHPLQTIRPEELTPAKLEAILDPCYIWDYRERAEWGVCILARTRAGDY